MRSSRPTISVRPGDLPHPGQGIAGRTGGQQPARQRHPPAINQRRIAAPFEFAHGRPGSHGVAATG